MKRKNASMFLGLAIALAAIFSSAEDKPLQLPEKYKKAWSQDNGFRGKICLNGAWSWQPCKAENREAPDESNWLVRNVPAFGDKGSFKITSVSGEKATEWKGEKIKGKERMWTKTTLHIPESWKARKVYLKLDGLLGQEPMVAINGKKMLIDQDIPYKFPLAFSENGTDVRIRAKAVKQNVWLTSFPEEASVRMAIAATSWRNKKMSVWIECDCESAEKLSARFVVSENSDMSNPVLTSKWQKLSSAGKGTFEGWISSDWKNPKPWNPDTPNLYYYKVELAKQEGNKEKIIDQTFSQRFGFRELWTEKGKLMLNGVPLYLRGNNHTPFGTKENYLNHIGNRKNIHWLLSKWKKEMNLNSFLIWPQHPGLTDRSKVLDVADELGLLVSMGIPYGQKDFSDDPDVIHHNQRMVMGEVKRYGNHPSILDWRFGGGNYTWICAPAILGQDFKPEMHWKSSKTHTEALRPLKEKIKKVDKNHLVFTMSGGQNEISDCLTGMVYVSPDAGLQERCNWPLGWWKNREKRKPLILLETACPYGSVFFQRFAANNPDKNEPIFLEHGAELFGDDVYADEPEKIVEKYFRKKEAIKIATTNASPALLKFKQAYLKYGFRAWRTYGMGFLLHGELRGGFDNRRFPEPGKLNAQSPGIYSENSKSGANDSAGELNEWGESIRALYDPFYAYIGGDGLFTSMDHAYKSGEKITKKAVILNDYFSPRKVAVEWCVFDNNGKRIFRCNLKGEVAPGERAINKFDLSFKAPKVENKTSFIISLKVTTDQNKVATDKFEIQVFPEIPKTAAAYDLMIYDPVGETKAMLTKAGCELEEIKDELPDKGVLVIGRHALENSENVKKLSQMGFDKKLEDGLKVIVFEQACKNLLGLKLDENSPRRTFISAKGHPVLNGIDPEDMRFWRGDSDLIEAYPVPKKIPVARSGWFPDRFWKWGNDNSVATYVIQKPMKGAFRSLIDSNFDLMYTPLLESCKGKGRLLFCQLDVTNRYGIDPVATRIVDNMLSYMNKVSQPDSQLTEVKYQKGDVVFKGCRLPKPTGEIGWGMNNGDFYFRKKVEIPVYKETYSIIRTENGKPTVSITDEDLQTNWQKYKYQKIIAALRMNQGGSSDIGVSTKLQGDNKFLYPIDWHGGYVHPYTGWNW